MKFSTLAVSAGLLLTASAKNILLTNDDGWYATNIRALYRDLTAAGYNVVTVAPAQQYSGNGGRFIVPSQNTLETDYLFSYPGKGSPAWGYEENDMNMWYFNGSPAACVAMGLDYVLPNYFDNMTVDLVIGGPNEGNNLGERDFALSGTIGAVYYATERGLPAIAVSGANSNNSFFKDNLNDDPHAAANINSQSTVKFVDALFESQVEGEPLLPIATALNINIPVAGTDMKSDCFEPTFRHTRLTGSDAKVYTVFFNQTSELITMNIGDSEAVKNCIAGDCDLPGEFTIIGNKQCEATVSAFTIDYDLSADITAQVVELFKPILS
ncbi:hypothetical protein BVG19_g1208 [[Candida] boidinii]|nr:hypothetical protein BVG19_g1208 [[Candida] boidinii]OWB51159.1 hypothetical protein B5S27_g2718 [[Candida] boidinii]